MIFKISLLFPIFLSFIFLARGEEDLALKMAEKFWAEGNYEAAITEYHRFVCFHPKAENSAEVYEQIGLSYRQLANFKKAKEYLRKAVALTREATRRDERRILLANLYLAEGDRSRAELELLKIAHFSPAEEVRKKAFFFLAICYLYTSQWQKAEEALEKYLGSEGEGKNFSVLKLSTRIKYKSPTLAKWLATFLPGLGQIYVEDWKNSLNAFFLNFLTTTFLVTFWRKKLFSDLALWGIGLWWRYYQGNRWQAEKLAQEYNQQLNKKLTQEILKEIRKFLP
jgi:tetratricopeptide (TPR) repeat protein